MHKLTHTQTDRQKEREGERVTEKAEQEKDTLTHIVKQSDIHRYEIPAAIHLIHLSRGL